MAAADESSHEPSELKHLSANMALAALAVLPLRAAAAAVVGRAQPAMAGQMGGVLVPGQTLAAPPGLEEPRAPLVPCGMRLPPSCCIAPPEPLASPAVLEVVWAPPWAEASSPPSCPGCCRFASSPRLPGCCSGREEGGSTGRRPSSEEFPGIGRGTITAGGGHGGKSEATLSTTSTGAEILRALMSTAGTHGGGGGGLCPPPLVQLPRPPGSGGRSPDMPSSPSVRLPGMGLGNPPPRPSTPPWGGLASSESGRGGRGGRGGRSSSSSGAGGRRPWASVPVAGGTSGAGGHGGREATASPSGVPAERLSRAALLSRISRTSLGMHGGGGGRGVGEESSPMDGHCRRGMGETKG